jgi:hypothetical protein
MADWVNIADTQLDPDAPLTSQLAYAWRDNPIAIAEGATGAPVVSQGWHPYNATENGQSSGLLYDHAVTGGVAFVETPVLAAGFEYRLFWELTSGGTLSDLQLGLRRASDSTYIGSPINAGETGVSLSDARFSCGVMTLENPFVSRLYRFELSFRGNAVASTTQTAIAGAGGYTGLFASPGDRVDRLRLTPSSGNISGGQVYLFRRKFERE